MDRLGAAAVSGAPGDGNPRLSSISSRVDQPRSAAACGDEAVPRSSVLARSRWMPWLVPGLLLTGWQIGATLRWLPASVLPAPVEVLRAGWQLTRDGTLPQNIAISAVRAMAGLALGGALGTALGIATALSPSARRLFDPTVQALRTVPPFALVPLVNTQFGVLTVDPGLSEMGRIYGMSRAALFRHVTLPGALAPILVGLRLSLGVMWLALIVAEAIAATAGVGYMANQAREFSQTDVVILTILVYAVLGIITDGAARAAERRLLRWKPAYGDRGG